MKDFMKRAALLLLMITSAFPTWAEELTGSCGEGLTYSLDTSTGLLKIEGNGTMPDYAESGTGVSPWYSNRSYVKSVQLPDGLRNIGNNAPDFDTYSCHKLLSTDF